MNFTPRIECETCVCTGFADEVCPPSNVFAFYNALPAATRKSMSSDPRTGHYGTTQNTSGNKRLMDVFGAVTVLHD